MSRRKIILVGFALLCLVVNTAAQEQPDAPRFENYAAVVRRGKVASLNLRSHPWARKYRTLMREQIKEAGVNFAGHYTLTSVGCGTGCSITAIIDARTGRAFFPKELSGWTSIVGDYEIPEGEDSRTFRANSRLLRLVGRPNIGEIDEERYGPSGIYYYEWINNRLRLVKFTHAGSYPEADSPGRPTR